MKSPSNSKQKNCSKRIHIAHYSIHMKKNKVMVIFDIENFELFFIMDIKNSHNVSVMHIMNKSKADFSLII